VRTPLRAHATLRAALNGAVRANLIVRSRKGERISEAMDTPSATSGTITLSRSTDRRVRRYFLHTMQLS
jgi:hypothetical protein